MTAAITFHKKVAEAAKSAGNKIAAAVESFKDMRESRLEICRACPSRIDLADSVLQCSVCKCVMTLKASLPRMKCPLGKW